MNFNDLYIQRKEDLINAFNTANTVVTKNYLRVLNSLDIEGGMKMGLLATILSTVGTLVASFGSQACVYFLADEPECPKSLVK